MDLSDSESEEPRRCKSDATEKSIATLKVRLQINLFLIKIIKAQHDVIYLEKKK